MFQTKKGQRSEDDELLLSLRVEEVVMLPRPQIRRERNRIPIEERQFESVNINK